MRKLILFAALIASTSTQAGYYNQPPVYQYDQQGHDRYQEQMLREIQDMQRQQRMREMERNSRCPGGFPRMAGGYCE